MADYDDHITNMLWHYLETTERKLHIFFVHYFEKKMSLIVTGINWTSSKSFTAENRTLSLIVGQNLGRQPCVIKTNNFHIFLFHGVRYKNEISRINFLDEDNQHFPSKSKFWVCFREMKEYSLGRDINFPYLRIVFSKIISCFKWFYFTSLSVTRNSEGNNYDNCWKFCWRRFSNYNPLQFYIVYGKKGRGQKKRTRRMHKCDVYILLF